MTIDRDAIIDAVADVLDEHAGACLPVHRELAGRIADRLGLAAERGQRIIERGQRMGVLPSTLLAASSLPVLPTTPEGDALVDEFLCGRDDGTEEEPVATEATPRAVYRMRGRVLPTTPEGNALVDGLLAGNYPEIPEGSNCSKTSSSCPADDCEAPRVPPQPHGIAAEDNDCDAGGYHPQAGTKDTRSTHRGSLALDLGVWIDDPPRIVLAGTYLDRLLELPISHVAVMLDGPKPGLGDAKWDWRDLEDLARRLPRLDRVLTAWIPADARAVAELSRELPRLLEALGTTTLELDAEGAGHWRERDVVGYEDADGDGRRLDDAAEAIAEVLWMVDEIETIEVTTYPGMLRRVAALVGALAGTAAGHARYVSQDYAVATRDDVPQAWDGRHGPVRMAPESRAKAETLLPSDVELCSGQAAYRTTWPDGRDSMVPGVRAAHAAGARLVRLWSSKWLARKSGHGRRRRLLEALRPLTRRPA